MVCLRRMGLRGRAIAFCLALVSGAVAGVSSVLIWLQHWDSIEEIASKAAVHARAVSYAAEPSMLRNDRQALEQVVLAAAGAEECQAARILDAQGKVLARLERGSDEGLGLPANVPALTAGGTNRSAVRVERLPGHLAVSVPVWPGMSAPGNTVPGPAGDAAGTARPGDRPVGFVQLIYHLDGVRWMLARDIVSIAAVSIVVILVAIGVTILAVRQLLTPVQDLVETASAISQGDFTKRACEQGVGEIGALARTFNRMADRMRAHTGSLEAKVFERPTASSPSTATGRSSCSMRPRRRSSATRRRK